MLNTIPLLSLPMLLVLVIVMLVTARGIVELIDYKQQKSSRDVYQTPHEPTETIQTNYNIRRKLN